MKAKKIILVVALAGIIYYMVKRQNTQSISETNTDEIDIGEDKYIEIGDKCILVKPFKLTLNMLKGADYFDTLDEYSETDHQLFTPIFERTTNVVNENGGLRKLFIYDFVKTMANAVESDIEPRPLVFEYNPGIVTLGDKGEDVKNLQVLINKIYMYAYPDEQVTIPITSTYDKKTAESALQLFKGTSALLDETKGTLYKEFINNFNTILSNLDVYQLNKNF